MVAKYWHSHSYLYFSSPLFSLTCLINVVYLWCYQKWQDFATLIEHTSFVQSPDFSTHSGQDMKHKLSKLGGNTLSNTEYFKSLKSNLSLLLLLPITHHWNDTCVQLLTWSAVCRLADHMIKQILNLSQ